MNQGAQLRARFAQLVGCVTAQFLGAVTGGFFSASQYQTNARPAPNGVTAALAGQEVETTLPETAARRKTRVGSVVRREKPCAVLQSVLARTASESFKRL
ncbi:hypothetical protein ALQ34_04522 [Pseudomonas syringae pv. maculicola]|nr:hypothetical protein ALQ34_04522 [Pseudomonas syringae pv. maculicola]